MKKSFLYFVVATMALTIVSCDKNGHKRSSFDPNKVNFEVTYDPSLDNTLYPSYILGLANYNGKQDSEMFRYSVTCPKKHSVLRIVMDSSIVNYTTTFQVVMEEKDVRYNFTPLVKWKYNNLIKLKQPGMVDLTFTCYINDEEVDIKNLRFNYRSVNECLLGKLDSNGNYIDYRWMFAAFVNEEHPYLDLILNEILQQNIITQFTGYQISEKKVTEQVFAIWYYVQTKGIHYSSITNTSRASKKVNTQYIRFLDEVYQNKQANCIDGCVFMASILKKIGLYPIIFIEPKHAYLGYYKDKYKKKLALLETTIVGDVDFSGLNAAKDSASIVRELNKFSKYMICNELERYKAKTMSLEKVKESISRESFRIATNKNNKRYSDKKNLFKNQKERSYQLLDISELRKKIQPITYDYNSSFIQNTIY